ncbi:MAG: hypothetical protein IT457_22780 [Planctomycetes bacterium]|nr:hypothetical protein [Planctomycetota bacterium]
MSPRLIIACAAVLAAVAPAQSIVSPANRDRFEGNSNSPYPLGRANGRFQQIHADLGASARSITGHAYRADATTQRSDVAAFSVDLEIALAVAARSPAQASTTFTDNLGAGLATVLPRTLLNFPTTSRPAADPAPFFEFRIPYATPFALPAGASGLCVDIVVHGNTSARGSNVNFLPYLDAQDFPTDGRSELPGYRFGSGCAVSGSNLAASARFMTTRGLNASLSLEIDLRDAVPSLGQLSATTALVVGLGHAPQPWPTGTNCTLYPTLDVAVSLPVANDPSGDWFGYVGLPAALQDGQRFYVQCVSGVLGQGAGDLTFSDASVVSIPPLGDATLRASRVANGSNRAAATGTFARAVTVTEFF